MGAAPLGALALLASVAACSSDETVLGDAPPTEIAVDPLEFLGTLPCSAAPGAAKSYVAALTDTGPAGAPAGEDQSFTLGAGPPTPCSSRTAFRLIVVGNAYAADVDVYDVPASELFPAGGATSGSRVMHDATGAVVAPRWRTHCDGGASGAVAASDTSVVVAGCDPIDSEGTAATAVRVDPAAAFPGAPAGELACRADGGAVDAIGILPSGPASETPLPPVTLACGDSIVFEEGLVAGQLYSFRLEAREAGNDVARWAATCSAIVRAGIEVTAECSTFTSSGSISIATATLEEAPGFVCGIDFDAFAITLDGDISVTVPRTSCAGETLVKPVPSGHYAGALDTFEQGVLVRTGACEVEVVPDTTTSLDCSFE